MKIQVKGCQIVAVQGEEIHSIKNEHYLKNMDVELFIFQEGSVLAIEYVHYKYLQKKGNYSQKLKGVKKLSGFGGLEIILSKSEEGTNTNQLNEEEIFNQNVVKKWLDFKQMSQFHQFNQLYRTLKELQKAQTTIVKPDDTFEAFQSCVDLSILSKRNDSLKELEQQYVKGQLKWAQIDMENADLAQRIKQLQQELQQKKLEINKLRFQYDNNTLQLLQSKQQLGDIINQAIEKGDHKILTKAGL